MSSSTPQRTRSQTSSSSITTPPSSHDQHNTPLCSAYSSAAKASEDWTAIEDRTERRRIQNRIAQRAYRQKLKERLISLERKAASTSSAASSTASSPSPEHDVYNSSSYSSSSNSRSYPTEDTAAPSSTSHFKHAWSTSPEISEFHFDEGIHMPAYLSAGTPSSSSSSSASPSMLGTTMGGFEPIAEEDGGMYYAPPPLPHSHHQHLLQQQQQQQHQQGTSMGFGMGYPAAASYESMYPDFDALADAQHSAYGTFAYPDLPFETYLRS